VFGDKTLLVAASYNIGEGGVSSRLRRLSNPFERGFIAIHNRLPKETKDYVPRWLAATLIANKLIQASKYKLPNTVVITHEQYKISTLASMLKMSKRDFYAANPDYNNKNYLNQSYNFIVLNKENNLPQINGFMLSSKNNYNIQQLKENQFGRRLAKINTTIIKRTSTVKLTKIKITNGLTYSHLKQWFGLNKSQLAKYNRNLKHGLISGNKINIPTSKLKIKHYSVKRGDTLGFIAKKHKISIKKLKLSNGLKKSRIYVGQKLQLWLPS
jgi:membrane-bound lytic murein transglycosylase D